MLYYIEQLHEEKIGNRSFYYIMLVNRRDFKYAAFKDHWFSNHPPNEYCLCCGTESW